METLKRQSILANVGWLAGANVAVKPLWFVFLLVSTRLLGPGEFGKYMYGISFVAIIAMIFDGGVDILLIREVAARPDEFSRFTSHSTLLKILLAFLSIAASYLAATFFGQPPDVVAVIMLAAVYSAANSLMLHFRSVFRAFEVMRYEAYSIMVEKLLVVACCGLALLISLRAQVFTFAYAAAYALAAGGTFLFLRRRFEGLRMNIDVSYLWNSIIRPALPFALMNIFVIIYFRSGTLILKGITNSETSVGYFNSGYRLIESYMMFPIVIVAPLYPLFSRLVEQRDYLAQVSREALRTIWAVSAFISIPIAVFPREVTTLLYGPDYLGGSTAVGLLGLATIPIGMTFLTGTIIAATGRQTRSNINILIVSLLNVALNVVMISNYGVAGAAITTLVTEILLAALNCWLVREFLEVRGILKLLVNVLLPLLMLLIIKAAGVLPEVLAVRLVLAFAVVAGSYFSLGVVSPNDIRRLVGRR